MSELTELPAWQALWDHFAEAKHQHMRDLFAADPERAERYALEVGGLFLDYSKNRITDETLKGLMQLARESGLPAKIKAMFKGEKLNSTENRAVLHVALRNRTNSPIHVDGEDVMPKVNSVLERMGKFAHAVRSGEWLGYTNQPITDIVNIGIGGSDLGPLMVCSALKPFGHPRLNMHFVSNVDGAQLKETLKKVHSETTLFVVESKTFTTQETLTNALTARDWFLQRSRDESAVAKHFVAVSTNQKAVADFGIDPSNMFEFWDWVGGRYSLWSAIGLPIMLYLGEENFTELLNGAHIMDQHFRNAPFEQNMPVLLAMIGVWYINFYGGGSHVIAPYDQYLHRLPAFIQQLDMESNGKQVMLDGQPVNFETAPIIWGETGINGQHAFFQLLHQGTHISPIDLIASVQNCSSLPGHHEILLANVFAQAEAFMRGKTADEVRAELKEQGLKGEALEALVPHKVFGGNRPTNTLLMSRLNPRNLGSLIALYEHKIFVQGVIWHINSFDQWGVELGKQLAKTIHAELTGKLQHAEHDSSTRRLIELYRQVNADDCKC
ncbi:MULTISPECIES: glucose-6-phosphate isomerase [Chromobacterium]|uniref:Glucose-6-phosphate isomerase n=2 Tax=Chromobacterium haemolyticum TaxID=394935 RepID=A0A1W0CIU5_9NEIS|nr:MULTISPECIES: glucose-6-phosphate isomerase [Chromobacterium]MDH0343688.1 glucose-6-phosphate isomerase [Chromobacterium haemolyticum]OQS34666.1 glucose-6-phosphate isomerase [Chromobacterium haemolyticum]QOZ82039.1 glucose-6-phosphate isomerase [Chromobacterium sp. Rain0013]WON82044.1 glucose-6-phosphate isomerase [Chromobacterium haemolyticum]BBH15580.1 glucose-6-phosphate isomerase 1 [Chromobacterium haemolyticum]